VLPLLVESGIHGEFVAVASGERVIAAIICFHVAISNVVVY